MKRRDFRMRFRCAECGRTRDEDKHTRIHASRLQGGNYRTPPRWGQSSICRECAEGLVDRAAEREATQNVGDKLGMRWSRRDLTSAVERLRARDKDEDQ